jgi:polysaccharide pyruvyl transferase WcaK-like protein
MIAALSAYQPVIVLGWSHKYQEVMAGFELERLVFDFNYFSTAELEAKILDVVQDRASISAQIAQASDSVRVSSHKQIDYLIARLDTD